MILVEQQRRITALTGPPPPKEPDWRVTPHSAQAMISLALSLTYL